MKAAYSLNYCLINITVFLMMGMQRFKSQKVEWGRDPLTLKLNGIL